MEEKRKKIRVLVGGVFDILHVGHIHFLKQAKELGDELVVIVAHDETVRMQKRREPINPAEDRAELLRAIRYVDEVYIGTPGTIDMELVKRIDPDVIAIGPDQFFNCEKLKEELRKHGINAEVIRIPYLYKSDRAKTSKIIQRIVETFCE
ncbi:glycerol-3-phosphate cytidylyltransferase [Thermococcus kodakarensis KOD1]|uniref:FAD synthase n=1 Tax=Thermococcus kodakarensis (strain ATCC BAA-918 / JCM 12380 / KOD1) TaxID=69014 RepID=RIBL_THEKO|nr:adenylyltransferase/cytidyltransferase family protein [Thermococcus kodakarensis]Q5JHT4.1 RecName: Full=FAD synthase; AltName: Full=FMN adenylyltransferase; AltName: Full=Flavin adenine dinucleotide synthase [Thermococcus kodakarensis KOD1]WCN28099.1 FAD synthase [Thermococcus kodakarensis]WCN30396.1 FAD synthase [Thermococcus kodakarensis]BAD86463.1 glycerol-3-phosphate cytidylyltransferase [Thermococcus kodakarensis KOD1]